MRARSVIFFLIYNLGNLIMKNIYERKVIIEQFDLLNTTVVKNAHSLVIRGGEHIPAPTIFY